VINFSPLSATVAHSAPKLEWPVKWTGATDTGNPVTFNGIFDIRRFEVQGNQVVAVGRIAGVVLDDATGHALETIHNMRVALPLQQHAAEPGQVQIQQVSCPVLNLVLGPLHLDLLGLVVDLNQVVLDITAVPGPGALLGNLLCAIVGLLDPDLGLLDLVADLLNSILDLIGSL
jgi:hypothetical protein